MKNLIIKLKVLSVIMLLIACTENVYSQNVISSVNVSNKAALFIDQVSTNSDDSELEPHVTENWMSSKNYLDFNNSENFSTKMFLLNEKVAEKKRRIEDWMINESTWKLEPKSVEKTQSDFRDIEDWMLDKNFWKIPEELDQHELEEWMIDDKFWVMVK